MIACKGRGHHLKFVFTLQGNILKIMERCQSDPAGKRKLEMKTIEIETPF